MSCPRCPVCRAGFRGTRSCSRCGADLTPLMLLSAASFSLRRRARAALLAGELELAGELAGQAESLCATTAGRRMLELVRWLEGSASNQEPALGTVTK